MSTKIKHSITLHKNAEEWLSKTAENQLFGTMNETEIIKYMIHSLIKIYPEGIPQHEFYLLEKRREDLKPAGNKIIAFIGGAE